MKRRILVVEDDKHLADGLQINLRLEGWDPIVAGSGEDGLMLWRKGGIDLILLDLMLPGMDGLELCRRIRGEGGRVPILFLTARGRDEDRVKGLEQGGDDYLSKPFNLRELLARIRGIFRRREWLESESLPDEIRVGDSTVNLRTFEAHTGGGPVTLKEKEVMILRLLAEKRGQPVDRATILDRVWGYDAFPSTRTVDNFIVSLRKALEPDPSAPKHILTVHGIGYRLSK
jgi:two-component system alkaline phosphatase synthesis response regulator PhoP